MRAEIPMGAVDALAWLDAQPTGARTYWRGRGEAEARAAWGTAAQAEGADPLAAVSALVSSLPPGARLYGTARFDARTDPDPEWRPFGTARFVLPRAELTTDGRSATLAVHVAPGEDVESALADLRLVQPARPAADDRLPLPFARHDAPDRVGWYGAVRWALDAFGRGALDKVVLARRAQFLFDEALDPVALLRVLEAATPRCFHTLVAPDGPGGPSFVSATPERLFRLSGRRVETEAVAGTRPRADLGADDDRLRTELLGSGKDRREHAFVRDAIAERLAPLTTALDVDDETSALTLARGRHLYAAFRGRLADGAGAADLLRALHPTPAVGGTPQRPALDAIRRLEPFDRGLYAGPVGWIGRDARGDEAAEFAVGIRSGLVAGRTLSLYSGAGIVEGSEPAAEWAEIEHKIGDFARVLGLADRAAA